MESRMYIIGFEDGTSDALDGLVSCLDHEDPEYVEGYWEGYYQALGFPLDDDMWDDY